MEHAAVDGGRRPRERKESLYEFGYVAVPLPANRSACVRVLSGASRAIPVSDIVIRAMWGSRKEKEQRAARDAQQRADAERRHTEQLRWVKISVGIAVVIGMVGYGLSLWLGSTDNGVIRAATQGGGKLELSTLTVRNELPNRRGVTTDESSGLPVGDQPRESTPTVDITLLNHGNRREVVTRADIDIDAYAEVRKCFQIGEGNIPVAGRYTIPLPASPRRGGHESRITRILRQQIGPDDVNRFTIRFTAPDSVDGYTMYVLHIHLQTTGTPRIVDAGRVLIMTPEPLVARRVPEAGEFYLPLDDQQMGTSRPSDDLTRKWCFQRNLDELARITGLEGKRDTRVAALAKVNTAATWHALGRGVAARDALGLAQYAVEQHDPAIADLAVHAAKKSGDQSLINLTRRLAANIWLQLAQGTLKQASVPERSFPGALSFHASRSENLQRAASVARASLIMRNTAKGREVLQRAESMLALAAPRSTTEFRACGAVPGATASPIQIFARPAGVACSLARSVGRHANPYAGRPSWQGWTCYHFDAATQAKGILFECKKAGAYIQGHV